MSSQALQRILLRFQQTELTEREIYRRIANRIKDAHNRETLLQIADEEQRHYGVWANHTKKEVRPVRRTVAWYAFLARVFGFTFAIKRMEARFTDMDNIPHALCEELLREVPGAAGVFEDEERHEHELISMLEEERLRYVGSMVLGLNDALVEISGSLAGFAFAMQDNGLISLAGLITGVAATLSMTSSEFLSARSEGKAAVKPALYTGVAYLITVTLLILPYLLLPRTSYLEALGVMLGVVVIIIASFNYYIAVAKDLSFKKRFLEMAGISLGVAALSFLIGILVKQALGIDL